MDKQKQIEEMAKVINETNCAGESCQYITECIEKGIPFSRINTQLFIDTKHAEALYNAGYRKIPEGAVVLTREEYKQLQRRQEICKTCEEIATEMVKKARKETAEKFAERLRAVCREYDEYDELYIKTIREYIDEICKELTEVKQ